MPHRATLLVALTIATCLTAFETAAQADSKGGLKGRIGPMIAGRANLGALGGDYASGFLFGAMAGIDSSIRDSPWSVGLEWTTLIYGYYFASDSRLVQQTVKLTEISLGLRVRRSLGLSRSHILATTGGVFTASDVPTAPSDERRYVGFYGGLGYELRVFGSWFLAGELRNSRFVDGPENLSLVLGISTGI